MTPLVLNSLSSFCIVDMNCLSDEQQVKVFSHYVGCLLLYDFLCWVEAFFPINRTLFLSSCNDFLSSGRSFQEAPTPIP